MVGDPRDRRVYAIAIAMLGLAFVVAVAGVCWIVAKHEGLDASHEIWFLPAVVGGVFVGVLIPFNRTGAGWLLAGAVAMAPFAICLHLVGLGVIGAVLGGLFFGLFVPSPASREK